MKAVVDRARRQTNASSWPGAWPQAGALRAARATRQGAGDAAASRRMLRPPGVSAADRLDASAISQEVRFVEQAADAPLRPRADRPPRTPDPPVRWDARPGVLRIARRVEALGDFSRRPSCRLHRCNRWCVGPGALRRSAKGVAQVASAAGTACGAPLQQGGPQSVRMASWGGSARPLDCTRAIAGPPRLPALPGPTAALPAPPAIQLMYGARRSAPRT